MRNYLLILIFIAGTNCFAQIIPSLPAKPKEETSPVVKVKKEVITVYKEKESNKAIIKFLCDANAFLYIDGDKKGTLKKDIALRVAIAKGEYAVKVVSSENQNDYVKFNYVISEIGVEKLEEINLQNLINQRIKKESEEKERQRLATEAELKLKQQKENAIKISNSIEMINVGTFFIGKYEVTQEQWQAVMENNPSIHKDCSLCPVENVSWYDAQDFIKRLNILTGKSYRLPTEAEWEYAAKGGNLTHNYTFAGSDDINSVAWYPENSNKQTHAVGQKQPNELGIYDMSGNVWEWCSDWYDNRQKYRVRRGGSWFSGAIYGRVAFRDYFSPDYRNTDLGFRLVSP